jgi:hypothetical protein
MYGYNFKPTHFIPFMYITHFRAVLCTSTRPLSLHGVVPNELNAGTTLPLCTPMNKPLEGKRQLGKPRRRWNDNVKMDLTLRGSSGMDWILPAQDRDQCRALVNTVIKLRIL